jgi:hypothetical protein
LRRGSAAVTFSAIFNRHDAMPDVLLPANDQDDRGSIRMLPGQY